MKEKILDFLKGVLLSPNFKYVVAAIAIALLVGAALK